MSAEGDCLRTGLFSPAACVCHVLWFLTMGTTAGWWQHIPLFPSAWPSTILPFCDGSSGPCHTTSGQGFPWGCHEMDRVPQLGPLGSVGNGCMHRFCSPPLVGQYNDLPGLWMCELEDITSLSKFRFVLRIGGTLCSGKQDAAGGGGITAGEYLNGLGWAQGARQNLLPWEGWFCPPSLCL